MLRVPERFGGLDKDFARKGMTSVSRFLLCATTLVGTARAQAFDAGQLPPIMREGGSSSYLRGGYQEGRIYTHALQREILVDWHASGRTNRSTPPSWSDVPNPLENAWGNHKSKTQQQRFETRFFPTTVCPIDGRDLLVAGVSAQGGTVLERWLLSWPDPMPLVLTHQQTGFTHVPVVLPELAQRHRLYDADVAGRRFVRCLQTVRRQGDGASQALVQFHDSNDVHMVDLTSGSLTLLASGTNASGQLGQVAALADHVQGEITFGDRDGYGFCYSFRFRAAGGRVDLSAVTTPVLTLIDSDRDGSIDGYLELSLQDFAQQGWNRLESFNDWWLP